MYEVRQTLVGLIKEDFLEEGLFLEQFHTHTRTHTHIYTLVTQVPRGGCPGSSPRALRLGCKKRLHPGVVMSP